MFRVRTFHRIIAMSTILERMTANSQQDGSIETVFIIIQMLNGDILFKYG